MSRARRAASVLLLLSMVGCQATVGRTDRLSTTTASSDAASGVVSIRLKNVSDFLSFPPPKGANRVVSASIQGGPVRSVWLALDSTSPARVPLAKVDEGEYQVNLYGQEVYDLLRSERPEGEFRVFAETVDGVIAQSVAVCYTMRVLPERLDFSWDRATVTIYQRCGKQLPGSHGHLRIHIGDITAGRVLVSVYGPNQDALIDMACLRQGDTVRLPLAEKEYVLVLDQLVNLLFGRDYAIFSLVSADAWQGEQIERLLIVIEKSEHTFIRAGQEMTGAVFGAHLRQKLGFAEPKVVSVDQFIDQVASRSWISGDAYQIRLSDGDTVDVAIWLRQQVQGGEETRKEPQGSREPHRPDPDHAP